MNRKWEFYNVDEEKIREISEKHGISELLATVLYNRDVVDDDEIDVFLNPKRSDFHNPYLENLIYSTYRFLYHIR